MAKRDLWTEVMRDHLGGRTQEERDRHEEIMASWNYEYHKSFTREIRCAAKCRDGHACRAPSMRNGRCKLHGGVSTGARTREGIERIREGQRRRWAKWSAEKRGQPSET